MLDSALGSNSYEGMHPTFYEESFCVLGLKIVCLEQMAIYVWAVEQGDIRQDYSIKRGDTIGNHSPSLTSSI
jgi:hypothetical protein